MFEIDFKDILILIFAAFAVNYLLINEMSVYFLKKSYLSKWVLCFISSLIIVLLKYYIPQTILVLLMLSIVGGVEVITEVLKISKDCLKIKLESNKYRPPQTQPSQFIQESMKNDNSLINREDHKEKTNYPRVKPGQAKQKTLVYTNVPARKPKIINSGREYRLEEFLKESQEQDIILGSNLRSNLGFPTEKSQK